MIMQGCVISCETAVFFQKSRNLPRSLLTNNNFYCEMVAKMSITFHILYPAFEFKLVIIVTFKCSFLMFDPSFPASTCVKKKKVAIGRTIAHWAIGHIFISKKLGCALKLERCKSLLS